MENIIKTLMGQRLLVNLAVFMITLAGLFAFPRLNRESIPDVAMDMVTIMTVYPGASPSDTEEMISIPIEKKLRSISGLEKVRSYNVENVSVIVAYLADNAKNKAKVIQDIKDATEQVGGLPAPAHKPVVAEVTFDTTELVSVAFTGRTADVPYARLREFAKQAEPFFYDIDGIAKVEKFGYYDREYLVQVDPAALDRHRIGLNSLVYALRMRNMDIPGGALRVQNREFVLRTKGQFKNAEEVRNTPIRGNDAGFAVRVRDVATVTDTYEEADVHHHFNGKPAVVFKLWKKRSADELDLSDRLRKATSTFSVPGYDDVDVSFYADQSTMTRRRIASVIEEAAVGFLILGIFMLSLLGRRMSALVLAGIPVTFMVTVAVMWWQGITINIVSLFGMIMVLGMMVDFSIVIAENSHRYMEHGLKREAAVQRGVSEVFWSVTVTLICIVAAFMPLLLVSGMIGKFVKAIPIVIIATLIAAWAVAMFIMPTYLGMFLGESHTKARRRQDWTLPQKLVAALFGAKGKKWATDRAAKVGRSGEGYEAGIFAHFQRTYESLVRRALRHRYLTTGVLLLLLGISLALVPRIGFKFLPAGGEEQIRVRVQLPVEVNLDSNLSEMQKLEEVVGRSISPKELQAIHMQTGTDYIDILDPKPAKASYKSTFNVFLVPEKDRTRDCSSISNAIRTDISEAQAGGSLSGEPVIKVECVFLGPPVGKPVNVEIQGGDFAVMKKIAAEYADYLSQVSGVHDTTIDLESGKTEYRFTVNEDMAARTGVSVFDIGSAINAAFAGAVATRVNQNEEQVGVRVRYAESTRHSPSSVHGVKIANMMGGLIPLDAVTHVQTGEGYSQINRLNFKRLVQVQAEVDQSHITPVQVTQLLEKKFADIEQRYPGYQVKYGGEQEDTNKSLSELALLFAGALLFIFVVLTVFTRSLMMPVVIMAAIPFALVGVIFALFAHGQPMSFMSTLGLFSLAGIIVSNTLVLVQFITAFRKEGMRLEEALVAGGVVRLRPIILTAGSMVLELLPVIYGLGGKDYLVSPLALAFGYGLISATFITLVLIPCFYYIAEDLKDATARLLNRFGLRTSRHLQTSRTA